MDASKLCGSVFGLDMIALAWTYWPPTWLMTSAYSFSAPTATIFPLSDAAVAPPEQAATPVAISAAATASSRTAAGRFPRLRRAHPPRRPVPAASLAPPALARISHAPCRFAPAGQLSARFAVNDNRFYYQ